MTLSPHDTGTALCTGAEGRPDLFSLQFRRHQALPFTTIFAARRPKVIVRPHARPVKRFG